MLLLVVLFVCFCGHSLHHTDHCGPGTRRRRGPPRPWAAGPPGTIVIVIGQKIGKVYDMLFFSANFAHGGEYPLGRSRKIAGC